MIKYGNHPAYKAWKHFRVTHGYSNRVDSWYAGWLAFKNGWELAQDVNFGPQWLQKANQDFKDRQK